MAADSTALEPTPEKRTEYALGHDEKELKRLEQQAAFLAPSTRTFLERVGISSGMRVLDVGCGNGDVSFLAAELVGPTGEVIGFDRAEAAVSAATALAQMKGLTNVRFVQCEISNAADLATEGQFDAIVGRLVLLHQPDPRAALRILLRLVRPGGLVGFQEPDTTLPRWRSTDMPLYDRYAKWTDDVLNALRKQGNLAERSLLVTLVKAFDEAGITDRRIISSSPLESALDTAGIIQAANTHRAIAPLSKRMGVPVPFEDAPFEALLKDEVERKDAVYSSSGWVGAAGRLPCVQVVED